MVLHFLYLNRDGEKMKGISMFKIKEILRLKYEAKLSNRKIARALNISHSIVNDYTTVNFAKLKIPPQSLHKPASP